MCRNTNNTRCLHSIYVYQNVLKLDRERRKKIVLNIVNLIITWIRHENYVKMSLKGREKNLGGVGRCRAFLIRFNEAEKSYE